MTAHTIYMTHRHNLLDRDLGRWTWTPHTSPYIYLRDIMHTHTHNIHIHNNTHITRTHTTHTHTNTHSEQYTHTTYTHTTQPVGP